tara:strand:+ start:15 stop:254 length:240 start_codon:yes stop_codon:yes gene_type:complete
MEDLKKYSNNDDWVKLEGDELTSLVTNIKQTATATKQISLRVKEDDIRKCEARASAHGLKYQSVIKALIHQYANGKISI